LRKSCEPMPHFSELDIHWQMAPTRSHPGYNLEMLTKYREAAGERMLQPWGGVEGPEVVAIGWPARFRSLSGLAAGLGDDVRRGPEGIAPLPIATDVSSGLVGKPCVASGFSLAEEAGRPALVGGGRGDVRPAVGRLDGSREVEDLGAHDGGGDF
jgi:hypothetical protein